MKKLLPLALVISLGAAHTAHAQVNFIRMGMNAATLAKRAGNKSKANAATMATYQGQSFPMLRTTASETAQSTPHIMALETELDRCHTALLASATEVICTPAQLADLQTAMRNLAKVDTKNMAAYQQEATFYLAENARRQQAAAQAK